MRLASFQVVPSEQKVTTIAFEAVPTTVPVTRNPVENVIVRAPPESLLICTTKRAPACGMYAAVIVALPTADVVLFATNREYCSVGASSIDDAYVGAKPVVPAPGAGWPEPVTCATRSGLGENAVLIAMMFYKLGDEG